MTTAEKIEAFREFKKGWRWGEGIPFSQDALNKAKTLNDTFTACGIDTDAFPGTDGSIMLTLYQNGRYVEFDIQPDATVELHYGEII